MIFYCGVTGRRSKGIVKINETARETSQVLGAVKPDETGIIEWGGFNAYSLKVAEALLLDATGDANLSRHNAWAFMQDIVGYFDSEHFTISRQEIEDWLELKKGGKYIKVGVN